MKSSGLLLFKSIFPVSPTSLSVLGTQTEAGRMAEVSKQHIDKGNQLRKEAETAMPLVLDYEGEKKHKFFAK